MHTRILWMAVTKTFASPAPQADARAAKSPLFGPAIAWHFAQIKWRLAGYLASCGELRKKPTRPDSAVLAKPAVPEHSGLHWGMTVAQVRWVLARRKWPVRLGCTLRSSSSYLTLRRRVAKTVRDRPATIWQTTLSSGVVDATGTSLVEAGDLSAGGEVIAPALPVGARHDRPTCLPLDPQQHQGRLTEFEAVVDGQRLTPTVPIPAANTSRILVLGHHTEALKSRALHDRLYHRATLLAEKGEQIDAHEEPMVDDPTTLEFAYEPGNPTGGTIR